MKLRFTFECSRCGSKSFRPSSKWRFRDTLLRKIGITPQRCLRCRRRFYVFYPISLDAFFRALINPPTPARETGLLAQPVLKVPVLRAPVPKPQVVKTDVVWSTFAEADQSDTRN
ncbi:MAG TPA: hypothetical protein VFW44_06795 [Bryobacteraceae bacterium]|nr:hypothetical protein [Bryobacteraceae bacterium]